MTKAVSSEWPRLAGAAVGARDELRALAADLTAALQSGSVPRALVVRARDAAVRHAERLRIGLKHPTAEEPRRKLNRDLPVWMNIEDNR